MIHRGRNLLRFALAAAVAVPFAMAAQRPMSPKGQARIEREVRHELLMLPYYGVFDDLEYKVDGGHVTLYGSVTRPTLKDDAARAIKGIEGVEQVTNNIEVLPLSPMDDDIRLREYRAIYGQSALQRYALSTIAPIHIIVKNGNVTLKGVVANGADKNLANIAAQGVSGVFSVKNELQVESNQTAKR